MKEVRTAQPGDICLILEPSEVEIPHIRDLQLSLQARFGGKLHERVHFTFQRFDMPPEGRMAEIVRDLSEALPKFEPFPLIADDIMIGDHGFWMTRLLRWQLAITPELNSFIFLMESTLLQAGVDPHFPANSGWLQNLVTALEDVQKANIDQAFLSDPFPVQIFTPQKLTVSLITGPRTYQDIVIIPFPE
jgi:hypothetical protein